MTELYADIAGSKRRLKCGENELNWENYLTNDTVGILCKSIDVKS